MASSYAAGFLLVKGCPPLENEIGGAAESLRHDRKRLRLAVLAPQLLVPALRLLALTKEQAGRFAECPLQVSTSQAVRRR